MSKLVYKLHICPVCGEDLRYGTEFFEGKPTPAYLAEVLSAHYAYHNLESIKPRIEEKPNES